MHKSKLQDLRFRVLAVVGCLLLLGLTCHGQQRLDVLEASSRTLRNNPLNDPITRKVAVFFPAQSATNTHLPVVYYLPGYGGSSEKMIQQKSVWLRFVQQTADAGLPIILVGVDGRTRWGGSQYVDSPAQGNYSKYVAREVVPFVEKHYDLKVHRADRVIAGHSSGGFGALRLGMSYPKLFGKIVALSPDSDFEVSHRHLMTVTNVSAFPISQVKELMAANPTVVIPASGDIRYALGLSAAYAPVGRRDPGQFEWLYDEAGNFREKVWHRWMENDPLTIVQNRRNVFRGQTVYLDGPVEDEYKANIGARKMFEILDQRGVRCAFDEPPGKHSSRAQERLRIGLEWAFYVNSSGSTSLSPSQTASQPEHSQN